MSASGPIPWRQALAVPVALAVGSLVAKATGAAGLLGLLTVCIVTLWLVVRHLADPDDVRALRWLLRWTMGAFVLHLALSVVLNAVLYGQSDAQTYHRGAEAILRHWRGGFPLPSLPSGKEGFYFLVAGIFWLLGPHNLAGLIVNAAFSAALVPVVTDLSRRLLGHDAADRVPALVVFLPGLLLWTSQLLKEAPIILLIAVAMSSGVRLLGRLSLPALATLAVSLSLLFTLRSYVGLVLAVGIVGGIALGRPSVLGGLGAGLSAVILVVLLVTATGVGYSGYQAASGSNLKKADVVRKGLAGSADSGFGSEVDISTPAGALTSLPQASATFLLGPLPWQFSGGRQLVALPDVVVWWLLMPSLWLGIRIAVSRVGRAVALPLLPAVTTTALLSLVVSNFGTVVRERSQIVIILVPFLALGLAERARRRTERYPPRPTAKVVPGEPLRPVTR